VKQAWDETKLTRLWWHGQEPVPGDGLRTSTGRTYLILEVRGRTLRCLVLPRGEPVDGTVFEWAWARRRKNQTENREWKHGSAFPRTKRCTTSSA